MALSEPDDKAIKEKALGLNHPDVATSLNSLGAVYQSQGKYAEAVEPTGKPDLALTFSRKATAAVIAHAATGDTGRQHADNAHGLIEQRAAYFIFHVAIRATATAGSGRAISCGVSLRLY